MMMEGGGAAQSRGRLRGWAGRTRERSTEVKSTGRWEERRQVLRAGRAGGQDLIVRWERVCIKYEE